MFWIGKTLIYSQGNKVYYFYGDDNINQKIFTNSRSNTFVAGILSDRFILVSKPDSDEIDNTILTTPALVPLEPLLIGYLDSSKLDYNLVRECVVNMFTNQISSNLIEKFLSRDLKEVSWLFVSDLKSSYPVVSQKVQIINDLLKFGIFSFIRSFLKIKYNFIIDTPLK